MASTYSPTLRIELIGDGDQSGIWGQTTNNNLGDLIEQAITGVTSIVMTDANYTMTAYNGVVDESRSAVIVVTGTNTAQRNLVAPLVEKTYIIKNSTTGGFGVNVIGATGTGVVVPSGMTAAIYCDGNNFYQADTGSPGNFTVNNNLTVGGDIILAGDLQVNDLTFTGILSGGEGFDLDKDFVGEANVFAASIGGTDLGVLFTGVKVAYKNSSSLTDSTSYPLTVYTNNTAQFCVTGTGNVGIATTSPEARLSVIQSGSNTRAIVLPCYGSPSNENYTSVLGKYAAGNDFCQSEVRFGIESIGSGTGFLAFATGTNSTTERMRITSAGNVGIGTSTPTAIYGAKTLEVNSASGCTLSAYTGSDNVYMAATSGLARIGTSTTSTKVQFQVAAVAAGTIDAVGNWGIGTTSPSYKLDVQTASASTPIIRATDGNVDVYAAYPSGTGTSAINYYGTGSNHATAFITNNTERMRITTEGFVGINYVPNAWGANARPLDFTYGAFAQGINGEMNVLSNAYEYSNAAFKYKYSGLGASRYISNFGTHGWYIAPTGNAGDVATFSSAMTLTSSSLSVNGGSLYVGESVSTGDTTLELGSSRTGSGNAYMDFHSQAGTDYDLRILRYSGANGVSTIAHKGTGTFVLNAQDAAAIAFYTNSTARMTIGSAGDVDISYSFNGKSNVTAATIGGTDGAIGFSGIKVGYKNSSSLLDSTSYPLQVFTNGSATMYVTGNGNTNVNRLFVNDAAASAANPSITFGSDAVQDTGFYWGGDGVIAFSTNGQYRGQIDPSGNLTMMGNVTAYSDERLKSDIQTITCALDTVDALRGVSYIKDDKACIGVVAQEVQKVLPQIVQENNDGYLSVAYGNIVGVLIEAVKELRAEVKALKGE